MEINQAQVREYATRLLKARMRILASNGFYGLLIEHLPFALDETVDTAATDGRKIYFGPSFLDEITDSELDFVLMHEVLHVVLQHCSRYQSRDPEAFNIACDIVINSTILETFGGDLRRISIASAGGELMHLAPNGKEGYLYTAEEVYDMLPKEHGGGGNGSSSDNQANGNSQSKSNQDNSQNSSSSSQGKQSDKNSQNGSSGSQSKNSKGANSKSAGQGGSSQGGSQKSQGSQGSASSSSAQNGKAQGSSSGGNAKAQNGVFDDHSRWVSIGETDNEVAGAWEKYLDDALKAVSVDKSSNAWGNLPLFAKRYLNEARDGKVNWRQILNEFIQEELCDYSFSPPDRRFGDCDFFMPDFNVKDESVKNILFMIDTSGSMSDKLISEAFDEVRGALYQYDGKLEGYLGFFDADVVKPEPFSSIDELEIIRPFGGGGTSFHAIFDYALKEMEITPCAIIILTDGYAPYPDEDYARGIPVLWLINNEFATPTFGKVLRIPND